METIYHTRQKRGSRKVFFIILLFLAILFIFAYFLTKFLSVKSSSLNIVASPAPPIENSSFSKELERIVLTSLENTRGNYGIAIKNLKSGESYYLNEHISYDTASLYKLWVMAETFRQIKNGMLKENGILSEDVKTLNEKHKISSESAELTEGTITLSVNDALTKMIADSDNYAALLLSAKIRLSKVASFLKTNGFNESTVGTIDPPITTAYDIALFFEKLYNMRLVNKEYSNKMIQLLKEQRLNNKISKLLPKNIIIAHKTGELDEYTHDSGIVYTQNGDYIIVVLSKSSTPDLAENQIANISEAVFNYFQNNK